MRLTAASRRAALRTLLLLAAFALVACARPPAVAQPTPTPSGPPPAPRQLGEAEARALVGDRVREILAALKAKDAAALAALAHPTKGVRFSPYPHVDVARDVLLARAALANAFADPTVRTWGITDGRGEQIVGTFADYHARWIYDRDFAAAPESAFNRPLGAGNMIDNTADVYPDAILAEQHFPNSADRLDWKSLRLLLEWHEGEWYLVGVVHGEWTI
ncbi:MAG: hypothetical protein ACRDGE_10955 [Candidatus Limnocylindria bacterium]